MLIKAYKSETRNFILHFLPFFEMNCEYIFTIRIKK